MDIQHPAETPQEDAVDAELQRILANRRFANSPSLIRFLKYAVSETLAGRAGNLRETHLAVHVFDRGQRFDSNIDPIVRVQAGKIRARLQDYYEHEGAANPLRIEFPKGSYVPHFNPENGLVRAVRPAPLARWGITGRRLLFAATAAGISLLSLAAWVWIRGRRDPGEDLTLTQLTYESESATWPVLSRDGKRLVYCSDRDDGIHHLWIRPAAGGVPVQLTHSSAGDVSPDISPDGNWIVFRSHRQGGGIYVIPALGGEERRIADHGWSPRYSPDGARIAYIGEGARDDKALFVAGAEGERPREVPIANVEAAAAPLWTPDGKQLLFLGAPRADRGTARKYDWYVVPWTGGKAAAVGLRDRLSTQELPELDRTARPGDWLGGAVVFSLRHGTAASIWKVPIDLKTFRISGRAIQLTTGSAKETNPRCTASGQIAFSSEIQMNHIFSLRLDKTTGRAIGAPEQLAADLPLNYESKPRLSADGKTLAFMSNQFGSRDVVIRDLAAGKETVLASHPSPDEVPLISGDGSLLLYRSQQDGSIYTTAQGGTFTEKVCQGCGAPRDWSREGRFVLIEAPSNAGLVIWDRSAGTRTEWMKYPAGSLQQALLSEDRRWVALVFGSPHKVFAAPLTPAPGATDHLVQVIKDPYADFLAWSQDGDLLYYFSRLDDHQCLWAQRLDAGKHPNGAPFAVYHFHTNRLAAWSSWISAGAGRIVFTLTEPKSNIWLAKPPASGAASR